MSKIKIGSIINRFAIIIPLVLVGCHGDSNSEIPHNELIVASALILNPTGNAPLAAELSVETQSPTIITIFVDDATKAGRWPFQHPVPIMPNPFLV